MGIQPLMPRDEQRNCVFNCFETESQREKKSLYVMTTFFSHTQDRLIRRQTQPHRDGGKRLSVPQIKLVRHPRHPLSLFMPKHASTTIHRLLLQRSRMLSRHHVSQHIWPTRNANCLLKVGEKKREKDQVKFPLFFRFFAHNSLKPLPLILHLSFFFF